jgi:hypothetical protein
MIGARRNIRTYPIAHYFETQPLCHRNPIFKIANDLSPASTGYLRPTLSNRLPEPFPFPRGHMIFAYTSKAYRKILHRLMSGYAGQIR